MFQRKPLDRVKLFWDTAEVISKAARRRKHLTSSLQFDSLRSLILNECGKLDLDQVARALNSLLHHKKHLFGLRCSDTSKAWQETCHGVKQILMSKLQNRYQAVDGLIVLPEGDFIKYKHLLNTHTGPGYTHFGRTKSFCDFEAKFTTAEKSKKSAWLSIPLCK